MISDIKGDECEHVNTGEEKFEQVNSFKYLGSVVNTDSSIEEEIKGRIAAVNRAYRVHQKTTHIKINIPKLRTTIYNTLIRPTVTYAYET